jgi:hypothetical protein
MAAAAAVEEEKIRQEAGEEPRSGEAEGATLTRGRAVQANPAAEPVQQHSTTDSIAYT